MLALGLILIILAALVVLTVLFGSNTAAITFDLTLFDVETSPVVVFFLGAATLLVLVAGIGLTMRGTRSGMRVRRDRKELDRLHARESEQSRATGPTEPQHREPSPAPESERGPATAREDRPPV